MMTLRLNVTSMPFVGAKEKSLNAITLSLHLPCPQEEAVAAVRGRVAGERVLARLLVDEDRGRVLAAVVDAVAVAAHVPVEGVVYDPVTARSVHAEPQAAVEAEVVAPDLA